MSYHNWNYLNWFKNEFTAKNFAMNVKRRRNNKNGEIKGCNFVVYMVRNVLGTLVYVSVNILHLG